MSGVVDIKLGAVKMSDLFNDISPADFMIKHAGNDCLNLKWSADGKPSIAGIFTRYTMPDKAGCGGSYCGRRELDCLLGAGFMDACDLIAVKICKEAKDE